VRAITVPLCGSLAAPFLRLAGTAIRGKSK
jgi:hypothetical protein